MSEYLLPKQLDKDIDRLESQIGQYGKGEITASELKAYRVPFGVYEQREDNTFMVRLRCPGGLMTPRQLSAVSRVAGKYGGDKIHLTTRQEIQIHYIKLDDAPSIMRELRAVNLASRGGGGNTVRNIISDERGGVQPREPFDVTPHVLELTNRLIAEDDSWTLPRKLKIAFSGTDEDNGLATVADLGFIARIRDGQKGFKIYVAGGFGSKPQVGRPYRDFLPESEVYNFAEALKRFFWKYGNRKNKNAARIRYLWNKLGEEEFRNRLDALYEKDSTVLLWLARKAFFGHVPMPLVHIDTHFKVPAMISYRDELAGKWKLNMVYGENRRALERKESFPHGNTDRLTCCKNLKSEALKHTLSGEWPRYRMDHGKGTYVPDDNRDPYTGVIVGVRADEEGSRSKERYFSPRDRENDWDVGDQPPEFWNQYKTDFAPGTHLRIHPLLDWTELNIWEYIERENIPIIDLYFNKGDGKRYRSLGCAPCTGPVESDAANVREIIEELKSGRFANIAERSGRAQDKEDGGGLETLRRNGYM